jgi:hypothetical protein
MQLHISYLRSLEDDERVRRACVQYLQNWLIYFYPERMDLVEQVKQMAKELGGQVNVPHLSWKYSWIAGLFGWKLAKHAQISLPSIRWSVQRFWDKTLFRVENPGSEGTLKV